ncbi:MAG: protein translocase subunit SecD [Acidimicrobiaceae bacterium]|nr:protein translocase subunit SecD [Acidimicrobiaceae bacterium]MCY3642961.1 protein translocase subunit SecD [Acidimicrobiaceae bacterium]MDE0666447.1 protein translocase subunit SecD [Acidimicrobiaceae bacterium]MXW88969.1 protein translocase subunit SecD [Acidimicrobiaceae bacterium]MXY11738.1 protein translocase subunit SecD [Acidimicrobiaceae bacterium]
MRRKLVYVIAIIGVAVGGVVYTLASGNEPLLGLDLQGGASVVLEPTRAPEPEELEVAVEIIRNRVDGLGVAEPEISTQGGNILVQLPGVDEQQRALDLVGQTAELRFRPVIGVLDEADYAALAAEDPLIGLYALTEGESPAGAEVILPNYDDNRNVVARYRLGPSAVAGDSLEGAVAQFHSFIGWHVAPTFKPGPEGIDLFNEVSRRCHSRAQSCPTGQVAIELDNEVVSAPAVQADSAVFSPFERSEITISGRFTEDEARDLALVLDYGALPVELEAQQSQIVSASLGTDALAAGVLAGLIGLALVSAYLIVYYRLLGLVAIASLGLSGAMLWTIIAWLGESQGLALTLAGVTGLVVAIGVSVDSNVVYFEHLKEDVRSGRTLRSAVDRAFPVAYSTIVKADFASLIAAGVLYWLTSGPVRGFALYLGLATILDLIATYFFMGPLIGLMSRGSSLYAHPGRFGIPASLAKSGATHPGAAS